MQHHVRHRRLKAAIRGSLVSNGSPSQVKTVHVVPASQHQQASIAMPKAATLDTVGSTFWTLWRHRWASPPEGPPESPDHLGAPANKSPPTPPRLPTPPPTPHHRPPPPPSLYPPRGPLTARTRESRLAHRNAWRRPSLPPPIGRRPLARWFVRIAAKPCACA